MIKTLRITSFIAVLLAMAIFALPIKYGVKTDQNVENFLNAPQIADIFKATLGSRPAAPVNQTHPLVQQAEAFALVLNPPKPVVKETPKQINRMGNITLPPPQVTPKFNLISTSYYPFNPEMSQALIEEGKRRLWVKQSSEFNHLIIEQVKDGVIVVRNGEETYELKTPERKLKSGLVPISPAGAGRITGAAPSINRSTPVSSNPPSGSSPVRPTRTPPTTAPKTIVTPTIPIEEDAKVKVEDLWEQVKKMNENVSNPDGTPVTMEEKALQIQKLISEIRDANMTISEDESQKLNDLNDYVEHLQDTSK